MDSGKFGAIEALAIRHSLSLNIEKLQAWGKTTARRFNFRQFLRLDPDLDFVAFYGLCIKFAVNWMEWAEREQDDPDFASRMVMNVYPDVTGANDRERLINGMADDLRNQILAAICTGALTLYDDLMGAVDISTAAQTADVLPALTGNGNTAAQVATERADDAAPGKAEATANTATRRVGRGRTSKMDAVIAQARKGATDPDDTQSVWDALYKLADSKDRPAPLLGVADGSIKWLDQNGEGEVVKVLTKKILRDRLFRAKDRAAKERVETR
jgi:hypothetical protein